MQNVESKLNISVLSLTFYVMTWLNFYKFRWYSGHRSPFLRARASIAIARISYGNSVCLSVCPSVTTRYQFKPRWDRELWVLPYDSLESLVFRDKLSYRWVRGGVPTNEKAKEGHPLKRRFFTAIGSSNVKMVADRHRHAAYHNKHWHRAS